MTENLPSSGAWLTGDVVAAVARHMNDDHAADTLAMAKPSVPDAVAAQVTGLDHDVLRITAQREDGSLAEVALVWPAPLTERADIRRYVVELYEEAAGPKDAANRAGHG